MKWLYFLINTVKRRLTPRERGWERWLYEKDKK